MHKKFELNRTKIKGAISCQSGGGQVSLVISLLYKEIENKKKYACHRSSFIRVNLSKMPDFCLVT